MVAKYSYIKFHKNPSSETELFHADGNTDGQTDATELRVAFCNCTNAPRKEKCGRRAQCNLSVKKSNLFAGKTRNMTAESSKPVLHYFGENYKTSEKSVNLRDK